MELINGRLCILHLTFHLCQSLPGVVTQQEEEFFDEGVGLPQQGVEDRSETLHGRIC